MKTFYQVKFPLLEEWRSEACGMESLVAQTRGWHSNVCCTPIFVLGQGGQT